MAGGFPLPSGQQDWGGKGRGGGCQGHLCHTPVSIGAAKALPEARGKQGIPGKVSLELPGTPGTPALPQLRVFGAKSPWLFHLPPRAGYFPCTAQMCQQQPQHPAAHLLHKNPHPCRIQVLRPQQTREISNQTAIINGFISIPMPQTFSTSHPFHNDAVSKSGARLSAHSQFLSTQRKKIANFFSCQHALCNTQWVILVPNAASTESWEIRWVPSSP